MPTQSRTKAKLDAEIKAELLACARAAGTAECCGALMGSTDFASSWTITRMLELTNRSASSETEYLITSDDVRFAQRKARAAELDVVGFFHSHPNGRSEPSATDLERAWPGYIYLILSGDALTAWTLDEERDQFLPVPLAQ